MNKPIRITNFSGGINLADPTIIEDNQLADATNMYYDNQGILSTRKGIKNFGNNIATASGQEAMYFTTFTNGNRYLLLQESTNIRLYNETTSDWDIIKSGLSTDKFCFMTFNDYVYITNGVDNVMSFDGTTIAEHATVTKVKYLATDKTVCYGYGDPLAPANFYYTHPLSELRTQDFEEDLKIDQSEFAVPTGLTVYGGIAVATTNARIYFVNVFDTNPVSSPMDYTSGVISNSSITPVENDVFFMSDRGMYSLSQRKGTTGSYRADSFSLPIQKLMDRVTDKSTSTIFYSKKTSNVYVALNDNGDRNNTLMVYSVHMSTPSKLMFVWTTYENINANDFCEYIDAAGLSHILVANAYGGQTLEIETGYDDNGVEILSRVKTKTFDFGMAETLKTFVRVDVGGLTSQSSQITYCIDVDGVETCKSFEGSTYAYGDDADATALGEDALGEHVLGGGAISQDGVTYFPYLNRRYPYQAGYRVSVKLESTTTNSPWKFTKCNVEILPEPTDMFNNNYIS